MSTMLRWANKFILWLLGGDSDSYTVRAVDSRLPKKLSPRTIYLVGEDGYLEHVSMMCPCGCGEVVHLNLLPDERPVWKIKSAPRQPITLYPSVWRTVGCRSHYWVRDGRVEWCKDATTLDRIA